MERNVKRSDGPRNEAARGEPTGASGTRVLQTCAATAVLMLVGAQTWADDYLKIHHLTDATEVMGEPQPAVDEVVEVWLGADRARMDTGKSSSVILSEPDQLLYVIDHHEKTWSEVPMDLTKAVSQMAGSDETAQMVAGLMGSMLQVQAAVTDTGEDKTVGRWPCRVYKLNITMPVGTTDSVICAHPDIDVRGGLYYRLANVMLAGQPGFQEALREMEKIKGLPVHTVSTVAAMNSTIRTTDELLDYQQGTAPAGTFDLPEGYTQKPYGPGG
jgi:hypothetical protein